ncbi:MAG: cytochrome b [Phreatobacter sp.]
MQQPDAFPTVQNTYSAPQRAVHWIMAILILCMVPLGLFMTSIPWEPAPGADPVLKGRLYELHKSVGLTIFMLAVLRVLLRIFKGAPPPEATLTPFERVASTTLHHLLYVLIFVVPVTGWIATSMCCPPVNLFWTVPLTLPISGTLESSQPVYLVHFTAVALLSFLVIGHAGAALMHLVIKRDGVFRRMWPSRP